MRFKQITPKFVRPNYSPTSLTKAYYAVKESDLTVAESSRKFGVPDQTLRDRVSGRIKIDVVRPGPEPILCQLEEAKLVDHLKYFAERGYGYSRHEVVALASDLAFRLGKRSKGNVFSIKWFHGFQKRWPEIRVLKPRSLEAARARASTQEKVETYFSNLESTLVRYDLLHKPERIFNIDEKGLTLNHRPPHIVAGTKSHPPAVTSGKSSTTTVIGCGNAAGIQVPPFFVFKGQRMREELMNGASPGAAASVSETGWSNSNIFTGYMQDHFVKYIPSHSKDNPVLVLLDGHKSHINMSLLEWAQDQGIIIFILPAHTSHFLQPLDVGCYAAFQKIYDFGCHRQMRDVSLQLNRYDVCKLACDAYTKALSTSNLQHAFRRTGIYPLEMTAINMENVTPSSLHLLGKPVESAPSPVASDDIVDDFFMGRVDDITRTKSSHVTKPAARLGPLVSGKSLSDPKVLKDITQHYNNQRNKIQQKSTGKSGKKTSSSKVSKTRKPLTKRCLGTKAPQKSPQPGPSAYYVDDSDLSDDDDYEDGDPCCICGRHCPEELRRCVSVVFVKWGQCDACGHWTHLTYCTKVTVLRRGDKFLCPHCDNMEE